MEQIHVTLPDGSVKDVPRGTTPIDIAKSISPRGLRTPRSWPRCLQRAETAQRKRPVIFSNSVDPAEDGSLLFDLRRPLRAGRQSCRFSPKKIPTRCTSSGHSAGATCGRPVMDLYPKREAGHWTAGRNGFFYEFLREAALTPGRPRKNRKEMREWPPRICKRAQALPRPSLKLYQVQAALQVRVDRRKADEPMVSFYTTGNSSDFCRGPHIPFHQALPVFKLMSVAGAY